MFMDEIASKIGAKPNLFKYFFTDFKLWKELFFGPCVPYQFRLEGPHPWPGAREAILSTMDRVNAPLNSKKTFSPPNNAGTCCCTSLKCLSSLFFVGILSYYYREELHNKLIELKHNWN
jgi:dimethylaniline monooxygenase (N-oxide forming)